MVRKRDHVYGCHNGELCLSFCRCWCHEGPNGIPTLPPEPPLQDVRRTVAPGKHVQITLKLNGDTVQQYTIGVGVGAPIEIDPGPMSVRTYDRLTIEARLL